jgi:hypothetical protein
MAPKCAAALHTAEVNTGILSGRGVHPPATRPLFGPRPHGSLGIPFELGERHKDIGDHLARRGGRVYSQI